MTPDTVAQRCKRHYQKHKEERNAQKRAYNLRTKEQRRAKRLVKETERRGMLDYMKRAYGCVNCGIKTGRLDYDHVRGEKLFNLSNSHFRPWSAVLAEIAKCEVRCVGCHTSRHERLR